MHVIVAGACDAIIDDEIDTLHIKAARSQISGHQYTHSTVAEQMHHAFAFILRHLAV